MRYFIASFLFTCLGIVTFLGVRGMKSQKPPVYLFPDMDYQAKYLPQGRNDYFSDQRNDRPVLEGTVIRGYGWSIPEVFSQDFEDNRSLQPEIYTGKTATGEWVRGFPIPIDRAFIESGRQKFTIFCKVCHGASGDGNGVTKQYGMIATATYHDDRIREMPEGEIFNTITHGKNTMLSYADKLTPQERWQVIAYVRALQRSQNATLEDVPEQYKGQLGL